MTLVIAGVILFGFALAMYTAHQSYQGNLARMEEDTARLRPPPKPVSLPSAPKRPAVTVDPLEARVKVIESQLLRGGVAPKMAHDAAVEQAKRELA